MKKIIISLALLIAVSSFVVAQNNNQNQNNQPQLVQPDMQKDTVALLAGHFAGPIKSADLAKEDSLFLNKSGLKVMGFTLSLQKDTSVVKFESKSNKMTPEMKAALNNLKPGQNFIFSNIRIIDSKGVVKKPTYDHFQMFIAREQ